MAIRILSSENVKGQLNVKDTQDTVFDSGLSVTRSLTTQTGYINIVGGAFNFNAPASISTKFRSNGNELIRIESDGDFWLRQVGKKLYFQNSAGSAPYIKNSGEDASTSPYGRNLEFYTDSYKRIEIDYAGTTTFDSGSNNIVAIFKSTDTETQVNFVDSTGFASIRSRNDFRFYVGGSSLIRAMDIADDGNVGIGTDSPTSKLHIAKTTTWGEMSNPIINIQNNGTGGNINIPHNMGSITWKSGSVSTAEIKAVRNTPASGDNVELRFSTSSAGVQGERMTINNVGNVGIGTTTPARKFVVSNGGASGIEIKPNYVAGVNEILSFDRTTGATAYETMRFNGGDFEFQIDGTTRVVIDDDGAMGINITGPTQKLDVDGVIRARQGQIIRDNVFIDEKQTVYFPNGTADLNVDIVLPNASLWGYLEVDTTGFYSNQNALGKLTKIYGIGLNVGGTIFSAQERISDSLGSTPDNIHLGSVRWDSATSTYRIRIAHIVSSGNRFTVKISMVSPSGKAINLANAWSLSAAYTQSTSGLVRQEVYYNNKVGIGESTPTAALQVNGQIKIGSGGGSGTDSNNMSIQVSNATYGDTANLGLLVRNNGSNGQFAQIGFGYSETKCPVVIGSVITDGGGATRGDFIIGTRSTTTGSDAPTERMRINSSGDVGIGYTNPSYKFQVLSNKAVGLNIGCYVNSQGPSTTNTAFYADASQGTSNNWAFYAASGNSYFANGIRLGGNGSSNELEHYEEGTWTPVIAHNDGTGVVPIGSATARYVRVGDLVYISCYLTGVNPNGNAGGSGAYYGIRGFPFQPENYGAWQIVYASSGVTAYGGYSSSASLYFMANGTNGQRSQVHVNGPGVNAWGSSVTLMMNCVYNING